MDGKNKSSNDGKSTEDEFNSDNSQVVPAEDPRPTDQKDQTPKNPENLLAESQIDTATMESTDQQYRPFGGHTYQTNTSFGSSETHAHTSENGVPQRFQEPISPQSGTPNLTDNNIPPKYICIDASFGNWSYRNSAIDTPTLEDGVMQRSRVSVSPHPYGNGASFKNSSSSCSGPYAQIRGVGAMPWTPEPHSPHSYGIGANIFRYDYLGRSEPYAQTSGDCAMSGSPEPQSPLSYGIGALLKNNSISRSGTHIQTEKGILKESPECLSPQPCGVGVVVKTKSFRSSGSFVPYPKNNLRRNALVSREGGGGESSNIQIILAPITSGSSPAYAPRSGFVATPERPAGSSQNLSHQTPPGYMRNGLNESRIEDSDESNRTSASLRRSQTGSDESQEECLNLQPLFQNANALNLDDLVNKLQTITVSNQTKSSSGATSHGTQCASGSNQAGRLTHDELIRTLDRLLRTICSLIYGYSSEESVMRNLVGTEVPLIPSLQALSLDLATLRDLPEAAQFFHVLDDDYFYSMLDRIPELIEDLEPIVKFFIKFKDQAFDDKQEVLGNVRLAIAEFLEEFAPPICEFGNEFHRCYNG